MREEQESAVTRRQEGCGPVSMMHEYSGLNYIGSALVD